MPDPRLPPAADPRAATPAAAVATAAAAMTAAPPLTPDQLQAASLPDGEPDIALAELGFVHVPPLRLRRLRAAAAEHDPDLAAALAALTNLTAFKDLTGWAPDVPAHDPANIDFGLQHRRWRPTTPMRCIDAAEDVLFSGADADSPLAFAYAFAVWKKDRTARIIIDPVVNDAPEDPFDCRLPDMRDVKTQFSSSAYMITLDAVSWFNQFRLSKTVSRLFSIRVGNRILRYLRLPMGWRHAPMIAQRTLLMLADLAGIPPEHVVIWIDNVAIHGDKADVLRWHTQLMRVLDDFGVSVREEGRGTCVEFLGVSWDLTAHTGAFLEKWRRKARDLVDDVHSRPLPPKTLQRLVGMCVWAHMLRGSALVFLSNLLDHLAHVTRTGETLALPPRALSDVRDTMAGLDDPFPLARTLLPMHPLDLWTDSSSVGAAFVWAPPHMALDAPVAEVWRWDSVQTHINLKELRALHYALLQASSLRDCRIRWACDSLVCVRIVRRWHTRSLPLAGILRDIVAVCRDRNLDVVPVWVSTNVQLADGPSRDTEGADIFKVLQ